MNQVSIFDKPSDKPATMTSREMADLTEKRHDSVKRTIGTLAENGVISYPQIVDGEKSSNGVTEKLYIIGKRDSYIIVAQLCPEFTARIVDRWQELETKAATPALPDFTNPAAAARAWADAIELATAKTIESAQQQARLAIAAPKADALDRISTPTGGAVCVTNAAKALQMQPKQLFAWLSMNQWIYRRAGGSGWVGYQNRIQGGHLEHKVTPVERSDGSTSYKDQVLITKKGLAKIALSLTTTTAAK